MPKVSFLTPVYNGAAFLENCVNSLLAQTHTDWEYVIVNNCSTDDTLRIAHAYAARDPRIKVHSNNVFVNADENHNIAFRLIGPDTKYVKVVAADDWITPDCVEKMVALAERHPSVGIVGSYQKSHGRILWKGLPEGAEVVDGRACARQALLHGVHVLGCPTSVLYRSDLVRARPSFFPHTKTHADTDVVYEVLAEHDLGFIHEVLSFDRIHPQRVSTAVLSRHADALAQIESVITYGPRFLSKQEHSHRLDELGREYHLLLGRSLPRMREKAYWRFHFEECRAIGFDLRVSGILFGALRVVFGELRHPGAAFAKAYRYFRARLGSPA